MSENVIQFPASKIIRHTSSNPVLPGQSAMKIKQDAQNVYDNVCHELFENYSLNKYSRKVQITLPQIEDLILAVFRYSAEEPSPDPEPKRYA